LPHALVSGAAGFIGSHLVDRLLADGWSVVGVDDGSTGRFENLASAGRDARFDLVRADVTDLPPLPGRFDRIWHLASPASPPEFDTRALAILAAGSVGTHALLALAERDRARFVLASSSEVYGEPFAHPQSEDTVGRLDPVHPRSVYAEAKRFAEATTAAWARGRGVDARIARFFNTYGPRMRPDDGRVVPTFVAKALTGEPLPVHGDGRQTRSMCYVDDLVEGLVRLGDSDVTEPCNLGRPDEIAMIDLARRVLALTGSSSPIEASPRPSGDPGRRCPDISRARAALGWDPRIGLDEGLARTIAWFRAGTARRR